MAFSPTEKGNICVIMFYKIVIEYGANRTWGRSDEGRSSMRRTSVGSKRLTPSKKGISAPEFDRCFPGATVWDGGCGVCHSSCQGVVRKVRIQMKAKEKYRGMFEIQKSGDKTSSGEIGLFHLICDPPPLKEGGGVSPKLEVPKCRGVTKSGAQM